MTHGQGKTETIFLYPGSHFIKKAILYIVYIYMYIKTYTDPFIFNFAWSTVIRIENIKFMKFKYRS